MKTFKQFLYEKLKLEDAKYYSRLNWDKTKYDSWFGHGVWRIYIPVSMDDSLRAEVMNTLKDVKIKDFEKNIAIDKYNREIKLTKIIAKDAPGLLTKYNTYLDKSQTAKGSEYMIVISRHPVDIAGMSTDREWESCTELHLGAYYQ